MTTSKRGTEKRERSVPALKGLKKNFLGEKKLPLRPREGGRTA